jgi:hypothetical protein
MASTINEAWPVAGTPTTASVRANFAAAKAEIEELQGAAGAWVPTIEASSMVNVDVTYSTRAGRYVLQGKILHWQLFVTLTGLDADTFAGQFWVAGLPLPAKNHANNYAIGPAGLRGVTDANHTNHCSNVWPGESKVRFFVSGANGYAKNVTAEDVANGESQIFFSSGWYEVD